MQKMFFQVIHRGGARHDPIAGKLRRDDWHGRHPGGGGRHGRGNGGRRGHESATKR